MTVAAVVVTYNRLNLLKECINALRKQTYGLDDIIIVNNSSTDGTKEWLEEQNGLIVITQENSGSAGGQYTGIKCAMEKGYDLIWIMDDDAVPQHDALEALMKSDPISFSDCVALSNTVLDYENNIILMHRRNINLKTLTGAVIPETSYKEPFFKVGLATFVGLLVFKHAIKKVGLPREDFFYQFDDSEYSLRLSRIGSIYNISSSVIIHPNDKKLYSREGVLNIREYYSQRNRIYTYKLYSKNKLIFFFRLVKEVILNILGIMAFRRQKWIRLKIYLLSLTHGLSGKLGYNSKIHRLVEKCQK